MKFKLDENFGKRTQQIFQAGGHDVLTVRDQELNSCSDNQLYKVCCSEERCLVTLDLKNIGTKNIENIGTLPILIDNLE